MVKRIIYLVLSLFFVLKGITQKTELINNTLISGQIRENVALLTYDRGLFTESGNFHYSPSAFKLRELGNAITLELGSQSTQSYNYSISVLFSLTRRDINQQQQSNDFELRVNYDNSAASSFKAKDAFVFSGGGWVKLTIVKITILKNNAPVNQIHPDFANIIAMAEVHNRITRQVSYRNDATSLPSFRSSDLDLRTGSIALKWRQVKWADEYQLEWNFVNSYKDNFYGTLTSENIPQPDWRFNSTRVTLNDTAYSIPAIYERGHLLFRIRAIAYNSFENDDVYYGDWFFSLFGFAESRNTIADVRGTNRFDLNLAQVYQNDKMNWQYIASYTEGGKRKDLVSFYDGSLRNRQTITRLSTDTITIAKETVYDHQGRPALNILSAPVLKPVFQGQDFYNRNLFYQPRLALDTDGKLYDRGDFDIDLSNACRPAIAERMSTTGGLSKYYSASNPDKAGFQAYLPDAGGYVFTRTIWTDDNSGRIKFQSGIGKEQQIGSGHETKYSYSIPSQTELDILFGNDIGNAIHYRKTVISDPNGQQTIQYKTLGGKIIATALTGNSPHVLVPLDSAGKQIKLNFIDPDPLPSSDGLTLQSNTFFSISTDGTTVRFNYNLTPDVLSKIFCTSGKHFCLDCRYKLDIEVKSDCGELLHSFKRDVTNPAINCENPGTASVLDTFSLVLDKGTYSVSKKLRVDTSAFEQFFQTIIADTSCALIHPDFDRPEDIHIDCRTTCTECDSIINSSRDPIVKERMKIICAGVCGGTNISPAELAKMQMLSDLSPGGQYALWRDETPDDNITPAFPYERFDLSVLNEVSDNKLLGNELADWRNPVSPYKDADGRESLIPTYVHETGTIPLPPGQGMWVSEFIENWKSSWAESLLPYHPEYRYWYFYDSADRASRTFNLEKAFRSKIMQAASMQEAKAANYLGIVEDPARLDSAIYHLGVATILRNKLVNFQLKPGGSEYYNLREFVFITGRCGYFSATSGSMQQCIDMASGGVLGFSGSRILDDRDWTTFRSLYMKERNKLIDSVVRDYMSLHNYYVNDCIGDTFYLEHRESSYVNDPPSPELYLGKQKRFPAINNAYDNLDIDITGDDASDAQNIMEYVNWKLYEKCQTCPITANLEALLNMTAYSKKLDKRFWLNKELPLPPALMEPLQVTDTVEWKGAVGPGKELHVILKKAGGTTVCELYLKPKGSVSQVSSFDWNKIIFLNCLNQLNHSALFPSGSSQNTFSLVAYDSLFNKYEIEGYSTCFKIKDCDPPKYCSSNCGLDLYYRLLKLGIEEHPRDKKSLITTDEFDYSEFKNCILPDKRSNIDSIVSSPGNIMIYYRWQQPIRVVGNENPIMGFRTVRDTCILSFNRIYNSKAYRIVVLGIDPVRQKESECTETGLQLRLRISYKDSTWEEILPVTNSCRAILNCCKTYVKKPCLSIIKNGGFDKGSNFKTELVNKKIYQCFGQRDPGKLRECIVQSAMYTGINLRPSERDIKNILEKAGIDFSSGLPSATELKNVFSIAMVDGERTMTLQHIDRKIKVWKQNIKIINDGIHTFSFEMEHKGSTVIKQSDFKTLFQLYVNGRYSNIPFSVKLIDNSKALLTASIDLPGAGRSVELAINYTAILPVFNRSSWYLGKIKLIPESCTDCCTPLLPPINLKYDPGCEIQIDLLADFYREKAERSFYDSLRKSVKLEYLKRCLQAAENFTAEYHDNIYQYTLFYYDQSGNLVKTIPPGGVRLLEPAQLNAVQLGRQTGLNPVYPEHSLVTSYQVNSLNQVISTNTPDGNTTRHWYDKLGRVILSQQARQFPEHKYSYVIYDKLGRSIESGEVIRNSDFTNSQLISFAGNHEVFINAIHNSRRTEVVRTIYDRSLNNILSSNFRNGQQFLRKRIGAVLIADSLLPGANAEQDFYHASHFSYDIHGNVKELVQQLPELSVYSQEFKHVSYNYDLASGLVTGVNYQENQPDQFLYRYKYDSDNRIILVETSTTKLWWDTDARYYYYKHGPLAREELGQDRVQGIDFAYTLQGWLKGINNNTLESAKDIGKDGTAGSRFPRDVFGFSIGYYDNDYKPIGNFINSNYFLLPVSNSDLSQNSLYNGNIAYTITSNGGFAENMIQASVYRYDQLNRLTDVNIFRPANNNSWQATRDYGIKLTYDANGNIKSFFRNGMSGFGPLSMDDLQYEYQQGTNKLVRIRDSVRSDNYNDDIDNQPENNYSYDASGNLISDKAEGLTGILWTPRGRIKQVEKEDANRIVFRYSGTGNRLSKIFDKKTFYYINDSRGNILATYIKDSVGLVWETSPIYGLARIGLYQPKTFSTINNPNGKSFSRGEKQFELTDHLGNIIGTVSDKIIFKDGHESADVVSATDYYAFGMVMPGRNYSFKNYKYAFQGKEKDDELKGSGNSYDFINRILDPRIGRWLSLDAHSSLYPSSSPFNSFNNNPINFGDPDGNDPLEINSDEANEGDSPPTDIHNFDEVVIKSDIKMPTEEEIARRLLIPMDWCPPAISNPGSPDPCMEPGHPSFLRQKLAAEEQNRIIYQLMTGTIGIPGFGLGAAAAALLGGDLRTQGIAGSAVGAYLNLAAPLVGKQFPQNPEPVIKPGLTDLPFVPVPKEIADPIWRRIAPQKQERHIKGAPGYEGAGYFLNKADAQAVLDAVKAGRAQYLGLSVERGHPIVRVPEITGYNHNPASGSGVVDQPTNVFMIKGQRSVSVVPVSPEPRVRNDDGL
jgi:RHS repeat-associated protein